MFLVKCKKCGKEIDTDANGCYGENIPIQIIADRDRRILIECDCGNEFEE